ncbi:MAG: M28 family peptidase [Myxococcota bacterium]|nr:M28 family peptidase [Myxococcota bacterium]
MRRLKARYWWLLSAVWFAIAGCYWATYFYQKRQLKRLQYEQKILEHVFDKLDIKNPKPRPAISDPTRLQVHVEALAKPRFTSSERKRARHYIVQVISRCGYTPMRETFASGMNIVATKRGRLSPPSIIVIGAHYDTVQNSPGANDNASGVAAVLEIACHLKTVDTQLSYRFIFFDGEEQNMLGSKAHLNHQSRRQNIVGAVILEMIGSKCTKKGCQTWPKSTPPWMKRTPGDFIAVVGDISHLGLMSALAESGATNRPHVHTIPVSGGGHAFPDSRRSDHSPFWDVGIDAVMVTDTGNFRYPHYHQMSDVSDHINYEFMAGVLDTVIDAVMKIDTSSLSLSPNTIPHSRQ